MLQRESIKSLEGNTFCVFMSRVPAQISNVLEEATLPPPIVGVSLRYANCEMWQRERKNPGGIVDHFEWGSTQATVIPDWNEGKRILAIIHHPDTSTGEEGLFVYKCANSVKTSQDLMLDKILPIRKDFKYDIETRAEDQSIIQASIRTDGNNLTVEVPFMTKSLNFFGNLKKCTNAITNKETAPQFRWVHKYITSIKPTVSNERPATVADSFGMAVFDAGSTATQYINAPFGNMQQQRVTVHSDSWTRDQSGENSNKNKTLPTPSYINAPPDPWKGMQPLVQFGGEDKECVVHPKPPKQQAWPEYTSWSTIQCPSNYWCNSTAWSDSDTMSTLYPPSSNSSNSTAWPDTDTMSSYSTGFDSKSQADIGFEDSFNDVLTLTSTNQSTLTTNQNTTLGSLSSLSVPSSSSSGSIDQPDGNVLMHSHGFEDLIDGVGYAEVRPVGRFKPAGIREEILKRREKEYTFPHEFRVFVGTWNVNGQPATEDLTPWLGTYKDNKKPDVCAIGFQELDLSKEAFLFNDSIREEEWIKAMDKALKTLGTYIRIKVIRLVGMMLTVYVQERHYPFISEIMAEQVGTGIMGKMGNKGGVAVRFEFHNTSFCFVNTHLAAHMEEFERRNQDYNDICNRMKFEWEGYNRQPQGIRQHDVVIWMGDLNYRISGLELEVVKMLIKKQDYHSLLNNDQLHQQLTYQKVFHGFTEGHIGFQPTYKYDSGTDDWDSSEKQRAPAWCDRILFKGDSIKQKVYRNHMELKLSDHKPVSSLFDIAVKVVDEKAFKQVVEEEIRNVDRQENEAMPQVTLSRNNLDFGEVHFMETISQTLDVANTGQVNTAFHFANKLEDAHFCKPFLKVEPSSVFLMPGDSVEVTVTVLVDKNTAASFNSGQEQLDDILVLHLDNGKDYYVTVSGKYILSSYGCSIEALVKMHSPLSELTSEQVIALEQNTPSGIKFLDADDFAKFDIPKEVWMLVDHLFRTATKSEDLFNQEGLHPEVVAIRNCLDNGMPDTMPGGIHSIAEALLLFLESLREPVIPHKYYDKCLECCNNFTLCKMVLKQIPKSHRNVFKYLAAFIRELLLHNDENKLDAKTLATVFGELFLRTPQKHRDSNSVRSRQQIQQTARKKATFVYQFIINEYDE